MCLSCTAHCDVCTSKQVCLRCMAGFRKETKQNVDRCVTEANVYNWLGILLYITVSVVVVWLVVETVQRKSASHSDSFLIRFAARS